MEFSFEVRESDLLGRIGLMRVGGKVLETPCLLPVIHPVNQAVTTRELKAMGFRGLMTNSYIIHSRRKDEALEKGIHRMFDYDGVFMTDSGGYQVLEYGDLEIDYRQVASFQADIGSDLAVTLDRPTGFSESEKYARSTMEYSLKNAVATVMEFGQRNTRWVGPVQGGLFPRLVSKSAGSLVRAGFEFLALGSPVQVMANYRFPELVSMITTTKRAIPYSVPLHLFGAGHPLTMALAIALGCDTFDSASYILFARQGRYMSERGVTRLEGMKFLPCCCPVCAGTTVAELLELDPRERIRSLALHNLRMLIKEVEVCKEAIAEGRLWDLVQEKAMVHPRLFEALEEFAKAAAMFRDGTPPLKERGLFLRNEHDLQRPELATAAQKLRGAVRKRGKQAILVVSAVSLPLGRLRLEDERTVSGYDVYRIHPTLGPYPLELEFVYPFTQTVVASALLQGGSTDAALKKLHKMGYSKVLLATADSEGRLAVAQVRSRRSRKGPSPSPPSSSSRLRSLRHP